MMDKTVGVVILLLYCAALPAEAQSTARGPQECAALRNLQLPGVALSEISAEWIPAGPAPRPFAPPPVRIDSVFDGPTPPCRSRIAMDGLFTPSRSVTATTHPFGDSHSVTRLRK